MRSTLLVWGLVVALAAAGGCWTAGLTPTVTLVFALGMGAVGALAGSLVASLREPTLADRNQGPDQVRDQGRKRRPDVEQ